MSQNGGQWGESRPGVVEGRSPSYVDNFRHTLDARNRVAVPASWRVPGDEENFYFAWPHPEGCIAVFPPELEDELRAKVAQIPHSDLKAQQALRVLFGNAAKLRVDKQGRVVLPEGLARHAGIQKEVVLVGVLRSFQIWSIERWTPPEFDLHEAMKSLGL